MCVFMVLDYHLFYFATVVQGERGGKLAWPSLSRSPQSPLLS